MKTNRPSLSLQIRAATLEDTEAIASVLSRSFAEFKSAYTPEAFAATTPTSDQLRARWSEGPVWVAVSTGAIVGTVDSMSALAFGAVAKARVNYSAHRFLRWKRD